MIFELHSSKEQNKEKYEGVRRHYLKTPTQSTGCMSVKVFILFIYNLKNLINLLHIPS